MRWYSTQISLSGQRLILLLHLLIYSPKFYRCYVYINHSVVSDSVNTCTIAPQAPLSMGFSRQEYWSGLPFCSPGDFPDPVIEPRSPELEADSLPSEPSGSPIVVIRDAIFTNITQTEINAWIVNWIQNKMFKIN